MPRQVFVSHASANADVAMAICNGLEARGVSCWIAPRDVAFDGTYGTEIMKGLRECDVFLILVTEAAAESQQVEREAERASHYKKRIIPVIVGRNEPGPRLEFYVAGRQQFPCGSTPDDRFLADLTSAIRQGGVAAAPPAPAVPRAPEAHGIPPASAKRLTAAAAIIVILIVAGYMYSRSPASGPDTAVQPRDTSTPPDAAASTPRESESPPVDGAARGGARPQPEVVPSSNPPASRTAAAPADAREGRAGTPPPPAPGPAPAAAAGSAATVNGAGLRFVAIPAGTFQMGCAEGDTACSDDERPVRRVAVPALQMSRTEVTQEFWEAVTGRNPSDFAGSDQPVESVSWEDAQDFVDRLTRRGDGFRYRLPTEAEWEYAARAGENTAPDLPAVAWFGLAQRSARSSRPQAVGTKSPNRWGLYDMLGNVAEWCEDWYSPGFQRVVRGGGWDDGPSALRLSARGKATPTTKTYAIGLRLVREPQ
jgi:formylglycine-generating enzyme required for sulfatase activity